MDERTNGLDATLGPRYDRDFFARAPDDVAHDLIGSLQHPLEMESGSVPGNPTTQDNDSCHWNLHLPSADNPTPIPPRVSSQHLTTASGCSTPLRRGLEAPLEKRGET